MNATRESHPAPGPEREPRPQPRIWIGSLADYNAGHLHGDWLQAAVDDDELYAGAQAVLDASSEEGAEEFGIFDYDEFGSYRVHEYADLRVVGAVARGIAEHGYAFATWAQLQESDPEMLARFEESYLGSYDSSRDWAEEVLEDVDRLLDSVVPAALRGYVQIDYASWVRDAELGGDVSIEENDQGGVDIFASL